MEKIELEYLLEALNYGLNDCVDLSGNTEAHYNQFANAIEVVKDELNLLNIPVVVGRSEQYCECEKPTLGKSVSRCGTCDEWFKPLK